MIPKASPVKDSKSGVGFQFSRDAPWKSHGPVALKGLRVFQWKGFVWIATDVWEDLAIYRSEVLLIWKRQRGKRHLQTRTLKRNVRSICIKNGNTPCILLAALAFAYAKSGDAIIKERLDYMVNDLALCQEANGDGYVAPPKAKRLGKNSLTGRSKPSASTSMEPVYLGTIFTKPTPGTNRRHR